MRVFINYKQNVQPDHDLARRLELFLRAKRHCVFRDGTGIQTGDKWPAAIEREIRNCQAMISIATNASMQSNWVLNEIRFAMELRKRVLPVVVGEIDRSVKFQAFDPLFMATQYYTSVGDDSADFGAILAMLKAGPKMRYQDTIEKAMQTHGVTDASHLLCASSSQWGTSTSPVKPSP